MWKLTKMWYKINKTTKLAKFKNIDFNKVETVEELKIKEFNEIFEEMLGVFTSLGKKQKKQIIKLPPYLMNMLLK